MIGRALIVTVALVVGDQTPTPSDADWTWLEEHRERALETLMPVTSRPGQVVAYRGYQDLYQDVHETYFAISRADRPAFSPTRLTASLILPVTLKAIQACDVG